MKHNCIAQLDGRVAAEMHYLVAEEIEQLSACRFATANTMNTLGYIMQ